MYTTLYKESIEHKITVRLDEVEEYIKDGWLDTPTKWGKEGVVAVKGWDYITPAAGKKEPEVKKNRMLNLKDEGLGGFAISNEGSLEDMSKADLEVYAREMFNVELDRRKSKANLIKEIEALEAK